MVGMVMVVMVTVVMVMVVMVVVVGIDGIDEHIDVGNYNKYIIMNSLHNYIYF